jgi:uncharacterized membrane protein
MNNVVKTLLAFLIAGIILATPVVATESSKFAISDVSFEDPVAPGQTLTATVTLDNTALTDDVKDITVKAWIEDSNGDLVGTKFSTDVVKLRQDCDKDVTVNIAVPSNTEEDTYTLWVTAEGKWVDAKEKVTASWNGPVDVEQAEHALAIENVKLSANTLSAGDSVDVAITVLNNGQNDENGVVIKAAITELGVEKSVKLINTLGQYAETTQYITLQLPEKVQDGLYTVKVTVYNDQAGTSANADFVVENAVVAPKPTGAITQPATGVQTIEAGKGVVFSMQIANNAQTAKTFSFTVGGASDWTSNVRVDPAVISLGAGESETVQIHMIPTQAGEHSFTLFVSDGATTIAGQQVKVAVTGNALGTDTDAGQSLVVLLIFVLVAAFAYWRYQTGGFEGSTKKLKQIYY